MKRSSPKRSATPIKRTARLPRSTKKIRARKADPSKRRFAKRRNPHFCAFIRTFPCIFGPRSAWGCAGPVECAHVVSRGAGGVDLGNCYPACRAHHRQQHTVGRHSTEVLYGLDLTAAARTLGELYQQATGGAHPGWEDGAE